MEGSKMGIIFTNKWLEKWHSNPNKIFEKLEPYFQRFEMSQIRDILTLHGMDRRLTDDVNPFIEYLPSVYYIIKKEYRTLMKEWNGPDIPIFLFPSDQTNRKIVHEYNGKSGLAFKDKLFLFLSIENTKEEIQALFTHEFNHVCRLHHYDKDEEDFTLLDTIVLEGFAEHAVYTRLGEKYLAPWTSYYSDKELRTIWNKIILPNKDISIHHRKHHQILYGQNFIPKMAGYAVGYDVVDSFMKKRKLPISSALHLNSEVIVSDRLKEDKD